MKCVALFVGMFLVTTLPATSDDHPFFKHICLRLPPTAGGTPKVIACVYRGQETMNTPSWLPDGQRLAFISNTTR